MSKTPAHCPFCDLIQGAAEVSVCYEDAAALAFMDIQPVNDGHVLVVPREHSQDLLAIDPDDLAAVARAGQRIAAVMPERLGADGVNLLNSCGRAAWQTVFHFHLHVIPRYDADPLRLPWTPEPGDRDAIAAAARDLEG